MSRRILSVLLVRSCTVWFLGLALLLVPAVSERAGAQHAISVEYRRIVVSGLSLYYERYGPVDEVTAPDGTMPDVAPTPPILLLHGLGAATKYWLKTAPDLARAGFTVYALDFPGFGESEVPPEKFSILDRPGQVAAFLQELGIGRVSVVGHSLGGYVAWLLAAQYPELVERLVLVDAAGLPQPDPVPETLPDPARWLESIAAPTLVVWGGRDALRPASDSGRFAALIPRTQLVVYPELGHVPMLEDPPAFLADLLRFLRP